MTRRRETPHRARPIPSYSVRLACATVKSQRAIDYASPASRRAYTNLNWTCVTRRVQCLQQIARVTSQLITLLSPVLPCLGRIPVSALPHASEERNFCETTMRRTMQTRSKYCAVLPKRIIFYRETFARIILGEKLRAFRARRVLFGASVDEMCAEFCNRVTNGHCPP